MSEPSKEAMDEAEAVYRSLLPNPHAALDVVDMVAIRFIATSYDVFAKKRVAELEESRKWWQSEVNKVQTIAEAAEARCKEIPIIVAERDVEIKRARIAEAQVQRLRETLSTYGMHRNTCILSRFEEFDPERGIKFSGGWYPLERYPKCECGLGDLLASDVERKQ